MKYTWFLFLAIAFLFASCGDDDETKTCETAGCENGGTCVSGVCDCPQGYSGEFCEDEDPCTVACVAPRTCVAGTCVCSTPGYEGPNCDLAFNRKFIDEYTVTEQCTSEVIGAFNRNYEVEIIAGSGPDKFKLKNFGNAGTDVVVDLTINSDGLTFVLPAQSMPSVQVSTTGGSGSMQQTANLLFNYEVRTGGIGSTTCNATLTYH